MSNDTAYHLIASLLEAFMWDGELVLENIIKATYREITEHESVEPYIVAPQ